MDFANASFDRILAVECIFHFASRKLFFEQVRRLLCPGGNLTITDFLQPVGAPPGQFDTPEQSFWGPYSAIDLQGYQDLADQVGLVMTHSQDITPNIRPSYHFFGQLLGRHFPEAAEASLTTTILLDLGALTYYTLRFDLPS
jgi:cyclopropane fatty-acyl-phospholipid synthase-like methyltransferase